MKTTGSNCAIIGSKFSKKHRLVLYQMQWTVKLHQESSLIFC